MLIFAGFIFGQNTANLTINISNIQLDSSKIFIGLYDNEADFKLKSNAIDSIVLIPEKEITEVSLKNIPFGIYAVAIFQDLNNNGKLDSKEFKIPVEPVGISNYTSSSSSLLPTFKKAQFNLIEDALIFIPLMLNKRNTTKK